LIEKFSRQEDARFVALYTQTSGYVHLSNKHVFNAMGSENEDGRLRLKITDKDAFVPNELYEEVIDSFTVVTKTLLKYMCGWAYTKENPEVTQRGAKDQNAG
jgi:hypothetical protein